MKVDPASLDKMDTYCLFYSAIVPRPIALVSTVGPEGVYNVAPYSCFAPLSLKPAILCLGIGWKRDGQKKDTLINIEFTKDFVVNIVNETLAEAMNITSGEYPRDVSEFKEARLTPVKSDFISSPFVAESPVSLECKVVNILQFGEPGLGNFAVMGEVLRIHVKDHLWDGKQIDASKLKAIARLGGDLYCRTTDLFEMKRPFAL